MKVSIPVSRGLVFALALLLTTSVLGLEVVIGDGGQPFADPFCGS